MHIEIASIGLIVENWFMTQKTLYWFTDYEKMDDVCSVEGNTKLQIYMNRLNSWDELFQMNFKIGKCEIIINE